jgi:hypothetical protein
MMAQKPRGQLPKARARKVGEAMDILRQLGFAPRQSNEVAGYTLLAPLDLKPLQPWREVRVAESPDHIIHFDGERFLGPYPDTMPQR